MAETVQHAEQSVVPQSATVTLVAHYSSEYIFIIALVAAILYVLGLIVIVKLPQERHALIMMDTAALMITCTLGRYTIDPIGLIFCVLCLC